MDCADLQEADIEMGLNVQGLSLLGDIAMEDSEEGARKG